MGSEITAKTTLVGLMGWPVSHSVSPAMHNAAFADLGLDWRYVPLPVAPEPPTRVGEAVAGLRALGLRGANVTVPHKQAVMAHLDRLTSAAQAIGAVNTILVETDGALVGDNTDARGFVADLQQHGVTVAGRDVLVLGAGGSARAVVYGLAAAGATRIVVVNRTVARAQALIDAMQPIFPHCQWLVGDTGLIAVHGTTADLIVNCTALGMTPAVETSPWDAQTSFRPGQVVYDLVYNPPHTRLLAAAAAEGADAIGGLGMLIWQGALAFAQWTGLEAPVAVMWAAAETQLAKSWSQPAASQPAVAVRRARPTDAAAISALNAAVQQLHVAAHPEFFKPPSATSFPSAYVLEILSKPESAVFVAEVTGRVVGYLYADSTPAMATSSTWPMTRLYIHHISVEPAVQGHGVGHALMAAAKEYARSAQLGTVALSMWDFNTRARAFFLREGFVDYNHRMWLHLA